MWKEVKETREKKLAAVKLAGGCQKVKKAKKKPVEVLPVEKKVKIAKAIKKLKEKIKEEPEKKTKLLKKVVRL